MSEISELLTDLVKRRSTDLTIQFGQENSIEHYGENIWEVLEHISEDYLGESLLHGDLIEVVDQWGGYEGGGESMGLTLKWRDEYVALTGYYNSWDSSYYDSVVEVFPEEKTIQIFKDKKGKEVDRYYN